MFTCEEHSILNSPLVAWSQRTSLHHNVVCFWSWDHSTSIHCIHYATYSNYVWCRVWRAISAPAKCGAATCGAINSHFADAGDNLRTFNSRVICIVVQADNALTLWSCRCSCSRPKSAIWRQLVVRNLRMHFALHLWTSCSSISGFAIPQCADRNLQAYKRTSACLQPPSAQFRNRACDYLKL